MRSLAGTMLIVVGLAASTHAQARQTTPPPAQGRQTTPPAATAATNDVTVTITYTGKGTVDDSHSIVAFLFAEPNVGPQSRPLGPPQIVTKNGQTVTFKNAPGSAVYVLAIYAEKSPYDGRSGPPPTGTPIGMYSKDGKAPTAVTPGPKTAIKLTFNDTKRWGQ
jgi:hypothetical protein